MDLNTADVQGALYAAPAWGKSGQGRSLTIVSVQAALARCQICWLFQASTPAVLEQWGTGSVERGRRIGLPPPDAYRRRKICAGKNGTRKDRQEGM